ncbi:hypothetical protein FQA39_LY09857 [Lamprigera yunnana]|nr:hypothetical protein FQA39_LY09857 [Lamprigera yunnana]
MSMHSGMEEPESGVVIKRLSVPIGLEELMSGLAKEVLLKKPQDVYIFASEHFARLLALRDNSAQIQHYASAKFAHANKENKGRQLSACNSSNNNKNKRHKRQVALRNKANASPANRIASATKISNKKTRPDSASIRKSKSSAEIIETPIHCVDVDTEYSKDEELVATLEVPLADKSECTSPSITKDEKPQNSDDAKINQEKDEAEVNDATGPNSLPTDKDKSSNEEELGSHPIMGGLQHTSELHDTPHLYTSETQNIVEQSRKEENTNKNDQTTAIAATKIQSLWRGYSVRKVPKVDGKKSPDLKDKSSHDGKDPKSSSLIKSMSVDSVISKTLDDQDEKQQSIEDTDQSEDLGVFSEKVNTGLKEKTNSVLTDDASESALLEEEITRADETNTKEETQTIETVNSEGSEELANEALTHSSEMHDTVVQQKQIPPMEINTEASNGTLSHSSEIHDTIITEQESSNPEKVESVEAETLSTGSEIQIQGMNEETNTRTPDDDLSHSSEMHDTIIPVEVTPLLEGAGLENEIQETNILQEVDSSGVADKSEKEEMLSHSSEMDDIVVPKEVIPLETINLENNDFSTKIHETIAQAETPLTERPSSAIVLEEECSPTKETDSGASEQDPEKALAQGSDMHDSVISQETTSVKEPIISEDKKSPTAIAATKIQSLWRGYSVRKVPKVDGKKSPDLKDKSSNEEELGSHPIMGGLQHTSELHDTPHLYTSETQNIVEQSRKEENTNKNDQTTAIAATKIQSLWRGYSVRKVPKVDGKKSPDLKDKSSHDGKDPKSSSLIKSMSVDSVISKTLDDQDEKQQSIEDTDQSEDLGVFSEKVNTGLKEKTNSVLTDDASESALLEEEITRADETNTKEETQTIETVNSEGSEELANEALTHNDASESALLEEEITRADETNTKEETQTIETVNSEGSEELANEALTHNDASESALLEEEITRADETNTKEETQTIETVNSEGSEELANEALTHSSEMHDTVVQQKLVIKKTRPDSASIRKSKSSAEIIETPIHCVDVDTEYSKDEELVATLEVPLADKSECTSPSITKDEKPQNSDDAKINQEKDEAEVNDATGPNSLPTDKDKSSNEEELGSHPIMGGLQHTSELHDTPHLYTSETQNIVEQSRKEEMLSHSKIHEAVTPQVVTPLVDAIKSESLDEDTSKVMSHSSELHDTVVAQETAPVENSLTSENCEKTSPGSSTEIHEDVTHQVVTPLGDAIMSENLEEEPGKAMSHISELHDAVIVEEGSLPTQETNSEVKEQDDDNALNHSSEMPDAVVAQEATPLEDTHITENGENMSPRSSTEIHEDVTHQVVTPLGDTIKSENLEEEPGKAMSHTSELHDAVIVEEGSLPTQETNSEVKEQDDDNALNHSSELHDAVIVEEGSLPTQETIQK